MNDFILTDSFEYLKTSCSPYDDMRKWFQDQTALYPKVEGKTVAGTSVRIYINTCESALGGSTLMQRIIVEYSIPIGDITYSSFLKEQDSTTQYSVPKVFKSQVTFSLDLREWPYFLAALAQPMLDDSSTWLEGLNKEHEPLVKSLWLMHFPNIPWDTALDLKASGLLPKSKKDFCEFIKSFGNVPSADVILPVDVTS